MLATFIAKLPKRQHDSFAWRAAAAPFRWDRARIMPDAQQHGVAAVLGDQH
jgi:hypothetical protein